MKILILQKIKCLIKKLINFFFIKINKKQIQLILLILIIFNKILINLSNVLIMWIKKIKKIIVKDINIKKIKDKPVKIITINSFKNLNNKIIKKIKVN